MDCAFHVSTVITLFFIINNNPQQCTGRNTTILIHVGGTQQDRYRVAY